MSALNHSLMSVPNYCWLSVTLQNIRFNLTILKSKIGYQNLSTLEDIMLTRFAYGAQFMPVVVRTPTKVKQQGQ